MSGLAAPEFVKPAHLWVPDHVATGGPEAVELAESIGLTPDPEQALALDVLLAEQPGGKYAAFEGAIVAPRQNIKTFAFKIVTLRDLFVLDTRLVVWTAHEFSTAMESFLDVKDLVTNWDHLRRRVRKVTEGNGEEGIELLTGQRLRFKARTISGGRGLTGDRVILDEAFALQPSHMGSLMPTMSALSITGNPQILYGSSGCKVSSRVLRRVRDRGRPGGDPYLAYIEWCGEAGQLPCDSDGCEHKPGTPGCRTTCFEAGCDHQPGRTGCLLDDPLLRAAANLALGRRISEDFLASERLAMEPEEFAREILGWHEDPPSDGAGWDVIDPDGWKGCCKPKYKLRGDLQWALDVSPGSRSAAIALSDGRAAEVVAFEPGTSWVIPWLKERTSRGYGDLALDANGPAKVLLQDLDREGIPTRHVTIAEHAEACAGLLAAIDDDEFVHIGQDPLDAAAGAAQKRTIVDVWLWTRSRSAGDICPLVAVTIARWAARALRPDGEADFFTL